MYPLPLVESERLVVLWSQSKKTGALTSSSYPDFADFREQNRVFEGVATLRPRGVTLTGAGEPERLEGARVSADFFPLLRVQPLHGRAFLPEEDRPGGERVVLLGHGLWQRRFGGDPSIIGQSLTLSGTPSTVVGVMPEDFYFPNRSTEFWRPIALPPAGARPVAFSAPDRAPARPGAP